MPQHVSPPCPAPSIVLFTSPVLRLARGATRPAVGVATVTTAATLGVVYLVHRHRRHGAAPEQDGLIAALEKLYDGSHRLGAAAQNSVLASLAYLPDIIVSEEEVCKIGLALLRAIEPFANSAWLALYASFAEGEGEGAGVASRTMLHECPRAIFVTGRACMLRVRAAVVAPLRWTWHSLRRGAASLVQGRTGYRRGAFGRTEAEGRGEAEATRGGNAHAPSVAKGGMGEDGRQDSSRPELKLDTVMRRLLRPLLPRFARVPTVAVLRVPLGYEWSADVELFWRALQHDSSTVVDNLVDLIVVEEEVVSSAHSSLRCSASPSATETGTTTATSPLQQPQQPQEQQQFWSRTERPQLRFGVFGAYAFYAGLYTACCLQEKDRVYAAAATTSGRCESAPRARRDRNVKAWRRKRDRAALSPVSSPLGRDGHEVSCGSDTGATPRREASSEEGGGGVDEVVGQADHATAAAAAPVAPSRLQLVRSYLRCFFVCFMWHSVCAVSLSSPSRCRGRRQPPRCPSPHMHHSLLHRSALAAAAMARVTPLEKTFTTCTRYGGCGREKTTAGEPPSHDLCGSQEHVRYKVHFCHISLRSRPVLQDLEQMLAQLRARWRREARVTGAAEHNADEGSNANNDDEEEAEETRLRAALEGCRRRERMREAVLRLLLQRCFFICSIQLPDMRVYRQVPPTVPRQIAAHTRGFVLYRTFAEEIRAQHSMLLRTVDVLHDWHRLYVERYGPAAKCAATQGSAETATPLPQHLFRSYFYQSLIRLRAVVGRGLAWTRCGRQAAAPPRTASPSPNSTKSWSDGAVASLTCDASPAVAVPPSSPLHDGAVGAEERAGGTAAYRPEAPPLVATSDPAADEGGTTQGRLALPAVWVPAAVSPHGARDGDAARQKPCSDPKPHLADTYASEAAAQEDDDDRRPREASPRRLPSTQSTVSSHLSLTAREVAGVSASAFAAATTNYTPPDASPAVYCPLQPASKPAVTALTPHMPPPSLPDAAGLASQAMPDPLHSDQMDYRTMTTLTTTLSVTPHMESNDSASELMAQLVQAFHTHGDASACLFDSSVQPRGEREPWQQSPPQPPSFCGDRENSCAAAEGDDRTAAAGGQSWRVPLSSLLAGLIERLRCVVAAAASLPGYTDKQHTASDCAQTARPGDGAAVGEAGVHAQLHGDGRVDVRQPFSPTWSDEENWRAERERWVLVQKFVSLYRHLHDVLCHEVTRVQRHCAEALADEGLVADPRPGLTTAARDSGAQTVQHSWHAALWRRVCRGGKSKDEESARSQDAASSCHATSPLSPRQSLAGYCGSSVGDDAGGDATASLSVVVGLDGLPRPRTALDMMNGHYGLSPFEVWLATRYSRHGAAEVFVLDLSTSRGDRYYPSSTVMDEVVAHAVLLHHGGRLRDFVEELASAFDLHYAPRTAWGRACMRDLDYVNEGSQRAAAPPPPPPPPLSHHQHSAASITTTSAGSEGATGVAERGTSTNRTATATNTGPVLSSPHQSHEEEVDWESYLGSVQSYESGWAAYGLRPPGDFSGSAGGGRQRVTLLRPYSELAHARELREDVALFCLGQAFLTRDGRDVTAEELQLQRELDYIKDYLIDNRNVLLSAMLTPHGSNRLEGVFGVPATVFPYLLCARESVALMHVLFDSLEGCYGALNFDHFAQFMRDVYYRDRPELLRQVPRIFRTINRSRRGCITYEELCGWMARQLSCGNNVRPNEHVLATTMSLRLPMVLLLDLKPLWPFLECTLDSLSDGETDF